MNKHLDGGHMERFYTTKRLLLRCVDQNYAQQVLSFYIANKHVLEPWEPTRAINFYTLSYQAASLAAERSLASRHQAIRYYLFEREHPEVIIGTVNFFQITHIPGGHCKLGYKLASHAWHKGYAYEAISYLIPLVFHYFSINRIEADIMPGNERSIQLIKRLNFSYEGISRNYCEIEGVLQDHQRYSLLSTDPMPTVIP